MRNSATEKRAIGTLPDLAVGENDVVALEFVRDRGLSSDLHVGRAVHAEMIGFVVALYVHAAAGAGDRLRLVGFLVFEIRRVASVDASRAGDGVAAAV